MRTLSAQTNWKENKMLKQQKKENKLFNKYIFFIALVSSLASTHGFAQKGFYGQLDKKIITTQNVAELNSATEFTFETQVYFNELSNWTSILGQIDNSTHRIVLQMHQGKLYCIVANGSNTFKYTPAPVLSAKQWYNIAMVYDENSANTITVYLDGKALSLANGWKGSPSGEAPDTTANFTVGSSKYDGLIDNVRVWNSALSANTISQWQDKTLDASHLNAPSLALNWDFEDYNNANQVGANTNTAYVGSVDGLAYQRQFVGSYFPYYALGRITPETAEYLSHIFYFSFGTDSDGELGRVKSDGTFTHVDNLGKVPTDIALLNSWRENYNTQLFVTVGGWVQSDYLDEALSSPIARANLIANIKDFLLQYNLNGVDIDWEHYHGNVNASHYRLFLQEMQASFVGTDLKISVTIAANGYANASAFEQYTDFVQLMTYGRVISAGTQYPLSTLKAKVNSWTNNGLSKEKLVIGLPAYSRPATKSTPDSLMYNIIVDTYNPPTSVDSVVHNGVTHYFNGLDTIENKANYAKKTGLKGVMIWDQGQDVSPSHAKSILVKAAETIGLNTQVN